MALYGSKNWGPVEVEVGVIREKDRASKRHVSDLVITRKLRRTICKACTSGQAAGVLHVYSCHCENN